MDDMMNNMMNNMMNASIKTQVDGLERAFLERNSAVEFSTALQTTHTPIGLIATIYNRLKIVSNGDNVKTILVEFNPEIVLTLVAIFKVDPKNITFVFDDLVKLKRLEKIKLGAYVDATDLKSAKKISEFKKLMKKLKEKIKNTGIAFDLVITNPPYQGAKRGGGDGSGNAIWQYFVEDAFDIVKPGGYVAMIHPNQWRFGYRKKMSKAQKLLFSNQMQYARLNFPFPGAGVIVDWYLINKSPIAYMTDIDFPDGFDKIYLQDIDFTINNFCNSMKKSIVNKVLTVEDNGLKKRIPWGGLTIYDETVLGNFPYAHGSEHVNDNKKPRIKPHPHIHQFNKKVIFCATRQFRAIADNGILGIGDHVHYLLTDCDMSANFMVSIANSKIMAYLQGLFSDTFFDYKSWAQWNNPVPLSQIRVAPLGKLSDEELYAHFNLTQEEIDLIESTVK